MSELSSGAEPQGKKPTRRRRNKRRRKDAELAAQDAAKSHADLAGDAPSKSGTRPTGRHAGTADGFGAPAQNRAAPKRAATKSADSRSAGGDGQYSRLNNPGRKAMTDGGRRNGSSTHTLDVNSRQLRNMRAVPKRQADVKFRPVTRPATPDKLDKSPDRKTSSYQMAVSRRSDKRLYAALDLGTNNCRLLVALPQQPGRFRVVDGFSRIVRLGEGLSQSGRLSEAAMERTIEALKICAAKLASRNIHRRRLIATEACRRAANGQEFLQRVKAETGLSLEVVNQESEARLAAEGCGALMDRKSDAAVLFDIGGGSSELILVDATGRRKKRIGERIVAWTSLPLGVVTLAERFGGQSVTKEIFAEMISVVQEHIDAFDGRGALERIWNSGRVHLLGTSGTVTTLAGFHLELPKYDRRKVDGIWMGSEQIDRVISKLLGMAYEERACSPCIGRERADLVLAGCAILEAIRNTWPANRLRVADRGLREGLLSEMINRDGAWLKPRKKNRWHRARRIHNQSSQQQDFQK